MGNQFDIVIVGNGILGLTTAISVATKDKTLNIAVLGPKDRLGGATAAAGAMLNAFGEVTSTTLKSKAGQTKLDMAIKSLRMWPEWIEKINSYLPSEKKVQQTDGTFVILNSKSGNLDSENYDAIIKAMDQYQEPYEDVPPGSIAGLNPVEDCRPLRAMYLPNEGSLGTAEMLESLQFIAEEHFNVTFIEDYAEKLNVTSGAVSSVLLGNGETISAAKIVLAAGAFCQKLIDQIPGLADRIPRLLSGVGHSFVIEQVPEKPIKQMVRTPNRSGACGLHAVPQKDGLYVGATNNVFLSPETSQAVGLTHFLQECTLEQINQDLYKSRILKWHTGNRPATIDTFPLVGKTSVDGLWLLTGTYRDGFHQSPLLADYISDQILNTEQTSETIFQPERLPIQVLSREESIEEAIHHYMCGAYERSMKLPKAGWNEMFRGMFRNRLKQLYKDLDTDFGLLPDMIVMLEFARDSHKTISFFRDYFKRIQRSATAKPEYKLAA